MRKLIGAAYRFILRPVLFLFDPEKIHDLFIALGEKSGRNKMFKNIFSLVLKYQNAALRQNILGIEFENPVGLAAGFDKNGRIVEILSSVGFGFGEIGSVTNDPCEGNPKPRLYRLKRSGGIIVNSGLPNLGADEIINNLESKIIDLPIGINIAKTNSPDTAAEDAGIKDYVGSFKKAAISKIFSYITINISCPNAFGGEPFINPPSLEKLLSEIIKVPNEKPIFIKMPADITKEAMSELLAVCKKYNIKGIILSNLVKDRKSEKINQEEIKKAMPTGGISGKPAFDKSNEMISFVHKNFKNDFIIIGCGGIFSAEDAYKKIKSGASLVELITGMIFEGPQLIGEINYGLARLLKKDGFSNIAEAVGADNK